MVTPKFIWKDRLHDEDDEDFDFSGGDDDDEVGDEDD